MEHLLTNPSQFSVALQQSVDALSAGDYIAGLRAARVARQLALDCGDEKVHAYACLLEATHQARGGFEEPARQLAEQILPNIDRLCTTRESIETRNIISRCYVNFGQPIKALPFALDALKMAQAFNDNALLAWALCRLGATYGALQFMPRCLATLERAVEIAEQTSDKLVKFGAYQNLANNLRWHADFKAQIEPIESLYSLKTRTLAALSKAIEYAEEQALRELYVYRTEVGLFCSLQDAQGLKDALKKFAHVCKDLENPLHDLFLEIGHVYLVWLEGNGPAAASTIENTLLPKQAKVGDRSTHVELLKLQYLVNKAIGQPAKSLAALEQIHQEQLIESADFLQEQAQLLIGEIEITDAKHEAKTWREQSEKSAQQIEHVRETARRDALTGLLNRRAFDEDIAQLLEQLHQPAANSNQNTQPTSHNCALAIVDIDHFKSINDMFGHDHGDMVLCLVGQGLHDSIRKLDRLYRYGGEEFVILTRVDNRLELADFCERTRQGIAQMNWADSVSLKLSRVTVSIGATLIHAGDEAKQIVIRADRAMYQAKRDGRNLARLDVCETHPHLHAISAKN
jgi:diguanylate cyclase (GGDEF)-like protein